MDVNLQMFSDGIDVYLLSSLRRKRKTGQLRPLVILLDITWIRVCSSVCRQA